MSDDTSIDGVVDGSLIYHTLNSTSVPEYAGVVIVGVCECV